MNNGEIQSGNVYKKENGKRGWFFGRLRDKELPYPWRYEGMQMKWYCACPGERKKEATKDDEGCKTITILMKGEHKVCFPNNRDKDHIMKRPGDFVFFEPEVEHTWEAGDEGSWTLTLRFPTEKSS